MAVKSLVKAVAPYVIFGAICAADYGAYCQNLEVQLLSVCDWEASRHDD